MKKFMVIYMGAGVAFEETIKNFTPEQQGKAMQEWVKWMNDNQSSIVESGNGLGKTKRADSTGITDTKNSIGGYSVVQAETHEAAAKLFSESHPHLKLPGSWVEILEIKPIQMLPLAQ